MSSSTPSEVTSKGKGKTSKTSKTSKSSPSGKTGKRPVTIEEKIADVEKKIKRQESLLSQSRRELMEFQVELERKRKFDDFVNTMSTEACLICRSDLRDCVGEPDMAIVSYKCGCSKLRLVHLGCWTAKNFRCACSKEARLELKSASGRDVKVCVSEVLSLESDDVHDEGYISEDV